MARSPRQLGHAEVQSEAGLRLDGTRSGTKSRPGDLEARRRRSAQPQRHPRRAQALLKMTADVILGFTDVLKESTTDIAAMPQQLVSAIFEPGEPSFVNDQAVAQRAVQSVEVSPAGAPRPLSVGTSGQDGSAGLVN